MSDGIPIDDTASALIERFAVAPDAQSRAVDDARQHLSGQVDDAAFAGGAVLRGRDRERGGISVLTRWRDAPEQVRPDRSAVLAGERPGSSRIYRLAFSALAPEQRMVLSAEGTPNAHFGIFSVAAVDQERMLDLARKNAPHSLDTPGIVGVNFFASTDGREVINLGLWTSLHDFTSLLAKPGFRDGSVYWASVAEFEFQFFDVAAVVAPR